MTDALRAKGMWDNLLILSTSDNGGPVYPGAANKNLPLRGGKLTLFDVGSRSGTALNGQSIGGHPISNGDVISIGRSEFTMMAAKPEPVGV